MNRELLVVCLSDSSIGLEWNETASPIHKDQEHLQNEIYEKFIESFSSFLLFLGFCGRTAVLSESLNYFRRFAKLYLKKLSLMPDIETLREKADISLSAEELDDFFAHVPFMTGSEYINRDFLGALWLKIDTAFKNEVKKHKGSVEDFIHAFNTEIHVAGRVYFHLVESKKEGFPFAFLATYSTGLDKNGKSTHIPLKHALIEYGKNSAKLLELLSAVHLAAKESKILSGLIENGEIFHPIALSAKEAYNILKEISLYEKSGILCRIPNWWKNKSGTLSVNVNIGNTSPSFFGKDALLDFEANIFLGNSEISKTEAKRLLSESDGLAFIKGKWVEVDHEKLELVLKAYENAQGIIKEGALSFKDAMRLNLDFEKKLGADNGEIISVSNGLWLKTVVERLRNPELIESVKLGEDFLAKLRPYQQSGLNWLYFLHKLGFGACLADDMGLGKTIQLIAFLNAINNESKKNASLLVVPSSLVSNWVGEILKFYPGMKYYVAHSSFNEIKNDLITNEKHLNKYDIVITTYSFAKKYEWLKAHKWNYVILDEAQAIKNPAAKQSKAIKSFNSNNRIILTGTPIENRLDDLWSLFDFLNPGMLGNVKEFSEFCSRQNGKSGSYVKLKKIISPYILRRLKTDKSVISDLPEKVEMKTYSGLSKKQVVLYSSLVEEIKAKLQEEKDGIQRKGLILSSIIKFKQICNHPDQYLGRESYIEEESGKFERLREICETIYDKRERVLVFTQFKEITEHLKNYLKTIFKHDGLVLHGGTSLKKRSEIVKKFQGHDYVPFMVLSIKAGGVGLNLTAANHVIHFDRWWNPAVENQATDRAFRIGQKKNVIVHKFIAKGSLEEKIDTMITEKSNLSKEIILSSNENWLTEMSNDKLIDMFKLSL